MQEIEITRYPTNKYVILIIYISGIVNRKIEIIEITAEVYLIHNLKAKLLIGVNILDSEKIDISFSQQILTINNK